MEILMLNQPSPLLPQPPPLPTPNGITFSSNHPSRSFVSCMDKFAGGSTIVIVQHLQPPPPPPGFPMLFFRDVMTFICGGIAVMSGVLVCLLWAVKKARNKDADEDDDHRILIFDEYSAGSSTTTTTTTAAAARRNFAPAEAPVATAATAAAAAGVAADVVVSAPEEGRKKERQHRVSFGEARGARGIYEY